MVCRVMVHTYSNSLFLYYMDWSALRWFIKCQVLCSGFSRWEEFNLRAQNTTKALLTQSQQSTNGLVGHDSSKSRVLTITPLGWHGSYNKTIGNLKQLIRNNFIQHCNQIHLNMICKNSKFHFSGGLILGNNITFTSKY